MVEVKSLIVTQDAPGPMIHVQLTNSSDLVIDPTTATNTATSALTFKQTLDPDPGRGELNNAATWDDFPNGRFGDYKSPAFGAQDQWGGSGLSVRIVFLPCLTTVLTDFCSSMKVLVNGAIPKVLMTLLRSFCATFILRCPRPHFLPYHFLQSR